MPWLLFLFFFVCFPSFDSRVGNDTDLTKYETRGAEPTEQKENPPLLFVEHVWVTILWWTTYTCMLVSLFIPPENCCLGPPSTSLHSFISNALPLQIVMHKSTIIRLLSFKRRRSLPLPPSPRRPSWMMPNSTNIFHSALKGTTRQVHILVHIHKKKLYLR